MTKEQKRLLSGMFKDYMPDINKIQDTMWGYMYAGFALRGEDVLDERTKDAASDAYGDLKVQFQSNLNPMIESVKMPVAALTGLSVR